MKSKKLAPIHPGEHLADILKEADVSANALALRLGVPANRITLMIRGKRGITAETALRLARYFGTSPQFWMNLQSKYDLDVAQAELAVQVEKEVIPPGGKIPKTKLNKIARNLQVLEDEADYQHSIAAIREGGKPVPLSKILKRYGRR